MASTPQTIEHSRQARAEIDPELVQQLRQQVGLIHRDEYCAMTGRTVRAVKRDWTLRRGPRPIRIGMEVFYRVKDIETYIEKLAAGREST